MSLNIVCDFHGTITLGDATDSLLERFAHGSWKHIEAQWLAGEIGSRDCMARQVALIEATYEALNSFLDTIEIDPTFVSFVDQCKRYDSVSLCVISDGIDYVIKRILQNNDLSNLRVIANVLVALPGNRYRLEFPHSKPDCLVQAGACKCAIAQFQHERMPNRGPTILVGDGLSDVCFASRADFVFAKDRLLDHCRTNVIPHLAFATFSDVTQQLEEVFTRMNVSPLSNTYFVETLNDA